MKGRAMAAYDATVNPTPAREVMATAEELARMEAALLTLPRLTREVFLAHRIDDLSYAEIAEITGLNVRQIERKMADAIVADAKYAGPARAFMAAAVKPLVEKFRELGVITGLTLPVWHALGLTASAPALASGGRPLLHP